MAQILYQVKQSKGKSPASGKWFAKVKCTDTLDVRQMAKHISEHGSIYTQDVVSIRGLGKVENVSMTAADMQLFDQRQFGVAEICRIMDVPRTLAMDGSNSSYKTPEAATQELMQRTIQPQIGEIEDELNAKLLSPADWGSRRYHVCELPLLRLDMKSQADIDLKRLQTGWSPNEIRGQYDMPAVDGGDDHYVSTNLAKAGSPKLTGETMDPVSAPTKPVLEPNGGEGAEGGEE